ncbi:hypothetical protein GQ53DRAFT_49357 [Thozetella sp. PMI_491]|nr:hypothetical protein GQ53DRAFT_49357 [Thozetella sp. PMI_491]
MLPSASRISWQVTLPASTSYLLGRNTVIALQQRALFRAVNTFLGIPAVLLCSPFPSLSSYPGTLSRRKSDARGAAAGWIITPCALIAEIPAVTKAETTASKARSSDIYGDGVESHHYETKSGLIVEQFTGTVAVILLSKFKTQASLRHCSICLTRPFFSCSSATLRCATGVPLQHYGVELHDQDSFPAHCRREV